MKILLVKNKDNEYGELVEMNELFAKILIKLGKAKENGGFGAKIGDLYWCGESKVTKAKRKQEKGGIERKVYTTKRLNYSILKKPSFDNHTSYVNVLGTRLINKLLSSHFISMERKPNNEINYVYLYPINSNIHRNIKSPYFDVYDVEISCPVVDYEKPLKKVLKSCGLWQKDWTDETYFSYSMIYELENVLNEIYSKNLGQEKEITI